MTNEYILAIPQAHTKQTPDYAGLPNEAAFNRVAELHERAKACNQPFTLEALHRYQHQRGLCVALTDVGSDSIAVFYISDAGLYAWTRRNQIHVTAPANSRHWAEFPLQLGMQYFFRAATSRYEHINAEPWGMAGQLKNRYIELHTPPLETLSSKKRKKSSDDESDGSPPALRPSNDGHNFTPLDSLEALGL